MLSPHEPVVQEPSREHGDADAGDARRDILAQVGEDGRLQSTILTYLQQNVATSITGICIAVLAAWFLYDWLVWRKHHN